MSKKLIVCCDGTWNTEDQTDHGFPAPTNVTKLARALENTDAAGVPQIVRHIDGVGTEWGIKVRGGAIGRGLFHNVLIAYQFLCQNYEPGDLIYLFGFSRGAFTARSLAGLVRNSGILKRGHEDQENRAVELYRDYAPETEPDGAESVRFRAAHSYETDLEMIGVWDTVGALGIPGLDGRFRILHGLDWQFHDVSLSTHVKRAYHALAIHEHRAEFVPTLWEKKPDAPKDQVLEQVWFSGVHCDVGGGYQTAGLSDVALDWMLRKAEGAGLQFDLSALRTFQPDPLAPGHDSFGAFYRVLDWIERKKDGELRIFGGVNPVTCEDLHESVRARFVSKAGERWPASFRAALP